MEGDAATLEIIPAIIAGLISGSAVVVIAVAMLALAPTRFPANPLYLIGSVFSIDTTKAYLAGLVFLLLAGTGYGIVISAALTGFEVDGLEFLWGGVVGAILSIVTGTTFAYSRSLNRAVRTGYVGDPGPFLLKYGATSMFQLIGLHVVFGVLTGTLYASLS